MSLTAHCFVLERNEYRARHRPIGGTRDRASARSHSASPARWPKLDSNGVSQKCGLLACELIRVSPTGRHRYFRLASTEVAKLIEQLQSFAPSYPGVTPGERRASLALRACRLCYDHLAGRLGVEITETMVHRSWLIEDEPWFRVTDLGAKGLSALGVRPALGRTCMDWSERKQHLAGPLGAQLAQSLMDKKFLLRDNKSRALRVTALGNEGLGTIFGISAPTVQAA